jgi:hypothetical protein
MDEEKSVVRGRDIAGITGARCSFDEKLRSNLRSNKYKISRLIMFRFLVRVLKNDAF